MNFRDVFLCNISNLHNLCANKLISSIVFIKIKIKCTWEAWHTAPTAVPYDSHMNMFIN